MINNEINSFFNYIDKGSDRTIIVFSAANTPGGKFSFYRSSIASKYNIIFLNTQNNDWYLHGIPGLKNIANSIATIEKVLKNFTLEQKMVITWGGSMGAFASVHYGSLLKKVTHIFAFGPELELGILHGNAYRFINDSKVDIYTEIKNNKQKNYQIFCGANDYIDMLGLSKLASMHLNHVHLWAIDAVHHALAPYVEKKFGMNNIILEYINNNNNLLLNEHREDLLYEYDLYKSLYTLMYLKKDISIAVKKEKDMYHLLSFFINRKFFKKAIYHIDKAIKISPKNIFLHHKKILYLYNKHKDFHEAVLDLIKNIDHFYCFDTQYHQTLNKIISLSLKKEYYSVVIKIYDSIENPFKFLDRDNYNFALDIERKNLAINKHVIEGKSDYLFLFDGKHNQFDYLLGIRKVEQINVDNLVNNISKRKLFCDKRNIDYFYIIFPSKPLLKTDFLPKEFSNVKSLFNTYYFDNLKEMIGDSYEQTILYPLEDLKELEFEYSTFKKYDTHMSDYGFLTIANKLLEKLNISIDNSLHTYINKDVRGDLSKMVNSFKVSSETFINTNTNIYRIDNRKYLPGNTNNIYIIHNINAKNKLRLLIYGDSFFKALIKFLEPYFVDIILMRSSCVYC